MKKIKTFLKETFRIKLAQGLYFLPLLFLLALSHAADTLKPTFKVKAVSTIQSADERYLSVGDLPTIQIDFSEKMNESTVVNASNIKLTGTRDNGGNGMSGNVSLYLNYDPESNILKVTPRSYLNKGWLYELVLTQNVQDLAGNGLASQGKVTFETLMDKDSVNSFVAADGKTQVVIPSQALPEDASLDVVVVAGGVKNSSPKAAPGMRSAKSSGNFYGLQYVSSSALESANRKLKDVVGEFAQEVTIREFAAINKNGERIRNRFNAPITIVMPYLDEDSDGYVDGVYPQVKVKDLKIYLLDEEHSVWNKVSSAEVDESNKNVTIRANHFSVYSVMGAPDGDVSSAHAFPVPFKASESSRIRFINLPSEGSIKIYTVTGELVTAVKFTITSGESVYDWDVKNSDGDEVASGVYAYVIESGSNKKTGKLVIIR